MKPVWIWLGLAMLSASAAQAANFEEVQKIKSQVVIPRWRAAAQVADALHDKPPDTQTAIAWRKLDALTDPAIGKAPLDQAASARNELDRLTNASWLRWRVLATNADARFSFIYAGHLAHMRNEEGSFDQEAVIFYFHGKLALQLDGMRCTDRTKAEHLVSWYATQDAFKELDKKVAAMPLSEKSAAILEAIAIEEMLGEREPMGWLCPRREPENAKTTAEATPRYLSDMAWRKYRSDLLEQLTRNAMKDL